MQKTLVISWYSTGGGPRYPLWDQQKLSPHWKWRKSLGGCNAHPHFSQFAFLRRIIIFLCDVQGGSNSPHFPKSIEFLSHSCQAQSFAAPWKAPGGDSILVQFGHRSIHMDEAGRCMKGKEEMELCCLTSPKQWDSPLARAFSGISWGGGQGPYGKPFRKELDGGGLQPELELDQNTF